MAVTSGETDVAKAVEHDGSGTVTVFLRRGVTGAHRLTLRGFQPLADSASPMPLPACHVGGCVVRSHGVRLYRQADMWVDVQAPAGSEAACASCPHGLSTRPIGRLVTAFELGDEGLGSAAGVTISLRPNEPRVDARLVTTLRRAGDKWEAIADFDARVASESEDSSTSSGSRSHRNGPGRFRLNPAFRTRSARIPGQRRHLIVRPWSPVTDRFQLRIRGPLELGANERGRTPNIVPLDVPGAERYFVLPTQLDQQRVDWETPGLVEVPLADVVPDGAADASRPGGLPRLVEAAGGDRRCATRGRPAADQPGRCVSRLPGRRGLFRRRDVRDRTGRDRRLHAGDSRRLRTGAGRDRRGAGGAGSAGGPPLAAAPGIRAAAAAIDDHFSRSTRARAREPTAADGRAVDHRPDVARTLWTIRGPAGGALRVVGRGRAGLSAAQQEVLRLRDTASLVAQRSGDGPGQSGARHPGMVHAVGDPPGVRRRADRRHTRWLAPVRRTAECDASAVEAVFQEQEAIAQRLKVSPTVMDFVRQTSRHPQASDVWTLGGSAGGPTGPL